MKRLSCIFLTLLLLLGSVPALAVDLSFLDDLSADELQEVRSAIDEKLKEFRLAAVQSEDEEGEVEATRQNPAIIGQTHLFKLDSYSEESTTALTMVRAIRGEPANALLKSFSRYNTSSSRMKKGEEWFAVMFHIEALESTSDKIDHSDYHFKFVSADGVEYDRGFISDNPLEVKSLYVGSEQFAWVCNVVKVGDNPLLTYNRWSDDTAWFNPNERVIVDTSSISYETITTKSSAEEITNLHLRLAELGLLKTAPTGKYDASITTALKKFQVAHGLANTGTADEETLRLLFSGQPLPQ
ncbi:MAG: peptidoglycan-binding protein [Clostridia bacterium]|nr:peptidoglycan-binding protein [Clostridia bacterium]